MAEILLKENAEALLNPGDTTRWLNVKKFKYEHHIMRYIVADIGTDVTVRVEAAHEEADGSEKPYNTNPNEVDTIKTVNGNFAISVPSAPFEKIRFNFLSNNGGTPTISVNYSGGG